MELSERYSKLVDIISSEIDVTEKQLLFNELIMEKNGGDYVDLILQVSDSTQLFNILSFILTVDHAPQLLVLSLKLGDLLQKIITVNSNKITVIINKFLMMGLSTSFSQIIVSNLKSIVNYACFCFQNQEISIYEEASAILELLLKRIVTMNFNMEIMNLILNISQKHAPNSIIFIRFISLFSKIASFSNDHFDCCVESNMIETVLSVCKSGDLLVQITAIEYLSNLASTYHGIDYLCTHSVIDWLINLSCGNIENHAFNPDPLLGTEALRILSNIFRKSIINKYELLYHVDYNHIEHFLIAIQKALEDGDEIQKLAGISAVSEFASFSDIELDIVLNKYPETFQAWFALLNSAKTELCGAVLSSIAIVLSGVGNIEVGEISSSEEEKKTTISTPERMEITTKILKEKDRNENLKKKLFHQISVSKRYHLGTLHYLLKLAQQPVPELRYPAIDVLIALINQPKPWGFLILFPPNNDSNPQDTVASPYQNEFFEYLINRETEHNKYDKDKKFSLIQNVQNHPLKNFLHHDVQVKIDKLIQQGAYFMPTRVEELLTLES